MVMLGTADCIA